MRRELLEASTALDRWPDKVRLMQRNWIGRSEGLSIRFALDPATAPPRDERGRDLHDAPRHAVRREVHRRLAGPSARRELARARSEARGLHRGVPQDRHRAGGDRARREEGLRHRHPRHSSLRSGWTLPVFVANFVLMDYGTGAIFGCPAHDQRDLDFVRRRRPRRDAGRLPARR